MDRGHVNAVTIVITVRDFMIFLDDEFSKAQLIFFVKIELTVLEFNKNPTYYIDD